MTQLTVEGNKTDTDLIFVENEREVKSKTSSGKLSRLSVSTTAPISSGAIFL